MKTIYIFLVYMALPAQAISQGAIAAASVSPSETELPVVGIRYYYYPNLDAYYDSRDNVYWYEEKNGQWVKSKGLKSGYRGYSLFNSVRVAITDYNGDQPYTKLEKHRKQFPKNYSSRRKPPKSAELSQVIYQ